MVPEEAVAGLSLANRVVRQESVLPAAVRKILKGRLAVEEVGEGVDPEKNKG